MEDVSIADAFQLPVKERIRLARAIWECVASSPGHVPLTMVQVNELDRCSDDYHDDPDEGSSWNGAKARLLVDE